MKKAFLILFFFCTLFNWNLYAQEAEEPVADNRSIPLIQSSGDPTDSVEQKGEDGIFKALKRSERKRAEKLYRDLGYKNSAEIYQSLSAEERKDEKVLAHLANSYRLNQETDEAEYWYAILVAQSKRPEYLMRYAQVLQSNGKCEEAVYWHGEYLATTGKTIQKISDFIKDCDELETFPEHPDVMVENLRMLNTEHLDFSPVPYRNGLVFTSTRGVDRLVQNTDIWTKDNFSDLFYAKELTDGIFSEPKALQGEINGKFHDGTATFNQGESVMIFSRNNYQRSKRGRSAEGLTDLKIYWAISEDGEYWADIEELPFNSDEFTTCHPSLSADGQKLYFASNRPGGFGGMDIYVSVFRDKAWGEPQNMGSEINSEGNELFPFVSKTNVLYFSSDGHKGMGGLDIFKVNQPAPNAGADWNIRENMGLPYNSPKDDLGFYINREETKGYLTSNRDGGVGEDDIYSWRLTDNAWGMGQTFTSKVCVYENETNVKVTDAAITVFETVRDDINTNAKENLILTLKPTEKNENEFVIGAVDPNGDINSKQKWEKQSNEEGFFNLKIRQGYQYTFQVAKEGYAPYQETVTAEKLRRNKSFCLPVSVIKCMSIDGRVSDRGNKEAMASASIVVTNKCTDKEMKLTSDKEGRFDLCVECGCEYQVKTEKEGYSTLIQHFSTKGKDCLMEETMTVKVDLSKPGSVSYNEMSNSPNVGSTSGTPPMGFNTPVVSGTVYKQVTTFEPITTYQPVTTYVPIENWSPDMLSNHFLGDANANFDEGEVFTMKEIYYDFGDHQIRADASKDLERLLKLLKTYPSMEIALEAHTDSRGSDELNQKLSVRRAKAATKFLVKRGISIDRITYTGFGETQLVNDCANGADCSLQDHQRNRRTEVRISKAGEAAGKIIKY